MQQDLSREVLLKKFQRAANAAVPDALQDHKQPANPAAPQQRRPCCSLLRATAARVTRKGNSRPKFAEAKALRSECFPCLLRRTLHIGLLLVLKFLRRTAMQEHLCERAAGEGPPGPPVTQSAGRRRHPVKFTSGRVRRRPPSVTLTPRGLSDIGGVLGTPLQHRGQAPLQFLPM
jgi:hypothetical protein